ncbi:MAG: adenylate/guanylate cyclase domain-containing protein [Myxococcaceae bacterium]
MLSPLHWRNIPQHMRLALKLSLLLLGASVGPLLVGTEVLLRLSRSDMRDQLQLLYTQSARSLADSIDGAVRDQAQAIQLSSRAVGFADSDEDQIESGLVFIYAQTKHVGVVGLFDEKGEWVGRKPYHDDDPATHGLPSNEAVDAKGLALYAKNIPPLSLVVKSKGPVIGVPYVGPDKNGVPVPRVVIAVGVPGSKGERWALAVELSLRFVAEQVADLREGDRNAYLVDQTGRVIAHPRSEWMFKRQDLSQSTVLTGEPNPDWLGSAGIAPNLQWKAVVEQPSGTALAPIATRTRTARILGCLLGLVVAIVLGFTTVRSVTHPVKQLRDAAEAISAGHLEQQVKISGKGELAELGAVFNQMTRGLLERERLKQSFSRYVSEEVASLILRNSSDLDLKGEQVNVTVVFIDVRGFTSIAERLSPREVVDLLNTYFANIIDTVMKYEGVINNFIGDAVMAVFGVPKEIPHPELRAVSAALEIQRVVHEFNDKRSRLGLEVLEFGIGVNTGDAIAGNLGGPRRMQYTVVGDAVNLAQRLQMQAKEGEVVVSTPTLVPLKDRVKVEKRGAVRVKGREIPVEIYRVIDSVEAAPSVDVTPLELRHE